MVLTNSRSNDTVVHCFWLDLGIDL